MRRWHLLLVAVLAAPALSSCAAATPEEITCAKAPADVVELLQTKVPDGTLRNANIRNAAVDGYDNGYTYISAEMLEPDDKEDTFGDILTWATGSIDSAEFYAVDTYAREHSDWPNAPFNVTEGGAVASRGCVSFWAGGPPEEREDIQGSSEGFDDLGFTNTDQTGTEDSDETTTTEKP